MTTIRFFVPGTPVPQGSMRHVGHGRVVHSNAAALLPWRDSVRAAAAAAMGGRELWIGPVSMLLRFEFPRPKSHLGTGRNAGALRAGAPWFHMQTPDIDKLQRAVLDALTGVVWRDDSQVFRVTATKAWTIAGGSTTIIVRPPIATATEWAA